MYGESERYLGANVRKYQLAYNQGKSYWSMHAYDYVVESCKMVCEWSVRDRRKFTNKRKDAIKANYRPEIDISDKLGEDLATQFEQMIGILRCSVELGRIDIITEVSFLSSFNVSPRRGTS